MGDLISRDALIKVVEADINRCYALRIDGVGALSHFIDQIKEQPTAFDIEAVMKELKELKRIEILGECPMESCSDCGTNCEGCYTTKAIEIVRKGGVK